MTETEAVERAREIALREGWAWREPVIARRVRISTDAWEVRSNAHCLGANVVVCFDADPGEVLEKKYLPR